MHSQLSTPTRLHASTIAIIAQVRATRNCRCVTCARLRALCLCTRILSLRWPQASRAAMAPADVHRALRIRRARRYSSYTQRVGRCDAPRPAHGAAACLAQPDLHLHSNARAERAHPFSPKDKQKNFRHLACTRAVLRLMSGFYCTNAPACSYIAADQSTGRPVVQPTVRAPCACFARLS